MNNHLISLTVFVPLIGMFLQAIIPATKSRWYGVAASILSSMCAIGVLVSMHAQTADPQSIESIPWIGSYSISYEMAIDGLNALLVLLIAILFPILLMSEWNQKLGIRGIYGLLLVLQTAFFGVVFSQDLFLQFFFWGLSALPFYFLVGIWGGDGREKAAFRSIVTSSIGNACIFAALILVYYSVDPHSFLLRELAGGRLAGKTFEFLGYVIPISGIAFGLISFGLAFRAPIWPLHGWFTSVAQEAPASVLVALSAINVPISTYIFIKVCYSLFPEILFNNAKWIATVGCVNLLVGGICAVSQKGLRGLIAFVCLSEVGLILMGIGSLSPTGVVGAVYQQLVLGLGIAGFGLIAGIISERTGIAHFMSEDGERVLGGLATRAPGVAVVAGVIIASLLGFPGFGGFVGHALVIIGSYSIHPMTIGVIAFALILATYYLFSMYRCIFLGKTGRNLSSFQDLTLREKTYLFPLVAGLLFFGLYPKPLIELIRPTILTLLSTVK